MPNKTGCETESGGLLRRHPFRNTELFSSHAERGESDLNGDGQIPCRRLGKLTQDSCMITGVANRRYSLSSRVSMR